MPNYRMRLKPATSRYPRHRKEVVEAKYNHIYEIEKRLKEGKNHCEFIDLEEIDNVLL